ncbi:MAG TPA: MmcQ/YjbR family DNA-binding protein [Marinagarivorans sp.]
MMTYQQYNAYCGSLLETTHVVQWGGAHVWKVFDKVFAIGGWEKSEGPAITFKVSELNYLILQDEPGFRPAPYLASRGYKWIQHYCEPYLPKDKLEEAILDSYRLVAAGLAKKKQAALAPLI